MDSSLQTYLLPNVIVFFQREVPHSNLVRPGVLVRSGVLSVLLRRDFLRALFASQFVGVLVNP